MDKLGKEPNCFGFGLGEQHTLPLTISYHATPHHTTPLPHYYHTILHHYHATPHYITPHQHRSHTTPHHTISHYTTSHYITPQHYNTTTPQHHITTPHTTNIFQGRLVCRMMVYALPNHKFLKKLVNIILISWSLLYFGFVFYLIFLF